jgi:3-isopropylmalate/(R)-2-methylmalate dehydratase small subunit
MEKLSVIEGVAMPVERSSVDTDQIVPARFLKKLRKDGFGQYLFHDLRFCADGSADPEFVLNRAPYREARILVAEQNFGCGSSREAAVWALHDYGFRAAIAPSFGDIFFNNCLKNGLVPVVLAADVVGSLLASLLARPGARMAIDLRNQTVALPDHREVWFDVDPFAKECLLSGCDELDYTLARIKEIDAFEARSRSVTGTSCR